MPKNFFEGDKAPGSFGKSSKEDAMKAYLAANPDVAAEISIDVSGVTEAASAISAAAASVKTSLDGMGNVSDKTFGNLTKAADTFGDTLGSIEEDLALVKEGLGGISSEQVQQTYMHFERLLKDLKEANADLGDFSEGMKSGAFTAGSESIRLFNTDLKIMQTNVMSLKNEMSRMPEADESFKTLSEDLYLIENEMQKLEEVTKRVNEEFKDFSNVSIPAGQYDNSASNTSLPIDQLQIFGGVGVPGGAVGGGGGINTIPPMLENPEEPLGTGSTEGLAAAKEELEQLKEAAESTTETVGSGFKQAGNDVADSTDKVVQNIDKTTKSMNSATMSLRGFQSLAGLLHNLGLPGAQEVRVVGELIQVNRLVGNLGEGINAMGQAFMKMPGFLGEAANEAGIVATYLNPGNAGGLTAGLAAAAAIILPLIAVLIAIQPALNAFNEIIKQSKDLLHEAIVGLNTYYAAIREGTRLTVAAQMEKTKADLAEVDAKLKLQKASRDNAFAAEQNKPSLGTGVANFASGALGGFGIPIPAKALGDALARVEFAFADATGATKEQKDELDNLTKKQRELTSSLQELTNAYNSNEVAINTNRAVQKQYNEEVVAGILEWANNIKQFRQIAKTASADEVRDLISANEEDQHLTEDKIEKLKENADFSIQATEEMKKENIALDNLKKAHKDLTGLLLQEAIARDAAAAGIKEIETNAKSVFDAQKLARTASVEKVNELIAEKEDQLRLNNEEIESLRNSGIATEYTTQKIKELSAANKVLAGNLNDLIHIAGPGAELNDAAERGKKVLAANTKYEEDQAKATAERTKNNTRAEADFQRSRAKEIADQNQKIKEQDDDYATERARKIRDNDQEIADISDKATESRNKLTDEYNKETIRKEEDLQHKLQQIRDEAADKIREAAANLDAKSVLNIIKSTNLKLKQEQDGADVEKTKRKQDLDQKLAEIATNAEEEKKKRQAAFAIQLADQDADYAKKRQRSQEDFAAKLSQEDQQRAIDRARRLADYAAQDAERRQKFVNDIAAIRANNVALTNEFNAGLNSLQTSATNWANGLRNINIPTPPSNSPAYTQPVYNNISQLSPSAQYNASLASRLANSSNTRTTNLNRLALGFATGTSNVPGTGIYQLHDKESVNDPVTSDLLRRVLGDNYSQNDLRTLAAGGGSTTFHWEGDIVTNDLGSHSKSDIREMFSEIVNEKLLKTFSKGKTRLGQ